MRICRSALAVLLSFPFSLLLAAQAFKTALPATSAPGNQPRYTVDAIRYATIPDFPVDDLVAGAGSNRKLDIAMIYWLVRGNGHTILVDAGFYRPQFFKAWTVRDFKTPTETLAELKLRPSDITDVVITHMHWDHADGMDLFPNAHIWIQKEEYAYYTGPAWQLPNAHGGIEPEDVLALVRLNLGGRVSLVDGDDQSILPGIRCYTGGKHTWASQYVSVPTAAGTVVIASDNMYLYENLTSHAPIAQTLDAVSNLRAQDRMRTLASDPRLILPGHDPAEFERFPHVAPDVVEVQ